ncbi:MAG TPA: acyltransferase, partial [Burkholderiales bacterium]|nr:acyltransferase [Burkholderiales bacterium]
GNIELGDNVRIDSYASLIAAGGGYARIGSYVHIGAYCLLAAGDGIVMEDFCGLSPGVRLFSRTDDYSGKFLTNPTVPAEFTGITRGEIVLRRHVIVGSGSVVLPRVTIGEGSAVGALSLVKKSLAEWGVYFGSPVRRLKERSRDLLGLEERLARSAGTPPE